jgi:hypothetical protein
LQTAIQSWSLVRYTKLNPERIFVVYVMTISIRDFPVLMETDLDGIGEGTHIEEDDMMVEK